MSPKSSLDLFWQDYKGFSMRLKKIPKGEVRTIEQLIEHYDLEKELAGRLKNSTKEERKKLYPILYDELFEKIPHHPQLKRKADIKMQRRKNFRELNMLSKFFSSRKTIMELGPGDCSLSFELCKFFRKVYAIDVSKKITNNPHKPTNFELIISDGSSAPVAPESIDVAYSNQLMEHLHPDDAMEQLEGIYRALVLGGVYICLTPHRFMGPHDISKYFDDVATGFHLKEYSNTELYRLFKSVGFRKIQSYKRINKTYLKIPIYPSIIAEYFLDHLPHSVKKKVSGKLPIRHLLSITIIATK